MAEQARPRDIAKGFASAGWWSLLGRARVIDVWPPPPPVPSPPRGRVSASAANPLCSLGACLSPPRPPPLPAAAACSADPALGRRRAALLAKIPDAPGVYVWLVRPPRTAATRRSAWSAVYLGMSGSLRRRLSCYLRPDGGFGPSDEPAKLKAMLDLMRRGFAVQVRVRPAKVGAEQGGAKADESAKLARWDFCLNCSSNGGRRPLELPSGRRAGEFPVTDARAAALYDAAVARERILAPPGVGQAGGGGGGSRGPSPVPLAVVRAAAAAGGKAAVAAAARGVPVPMVVAAAGGRA